VFPAVFLDRDGVLIENRADYIREWSQVVIFPKTFSALKRIHDAGYKIVIVTNQSAIGRGFISLGTANEINKRLGDLIQENGGQVDGVYLCPHRPEDDCDCRKPKPGMLVRATNELSLDLKRSWLIGDAWSDLVAGQAAHVRRTIMVQTGRGQEQLLQSKPSGLGAYIIAEDFSHAVDLILEHTSE